MKNLFFLPKADGIRKTHNNAIQRTPDYEAVNPVRLKK
jgi:hypothetical protein